MSSSNTNLVTATSERSSRSLGANTPLRVLYVASEHAEAVSTQDLLTAKALERYEVDFVRGVETGLRAIDERRHEVCLVDDSLGEARSLDFLQDVLARNYPAPVLLLTSGENQDFDATAMRIGAADSLPKAQVDARALERSIRHALERRQSSEALRRKAQELARSNAELADFAYIASHDLREPLRGIQSYAAFLLEDLGGGVDEDARAKLETIQRLSRRLEELIHSLLHYSRVGRIDLAFGKTDLHRVVADVLDSIHVTIEQQNVEIAVPRRLPTIRCDSVRVGEVFFNLITNAIKYNDSRNKRVEIGFLDSEAGEPGEDQPSARATPVTFYVRDNGIGIPSRHHASVFKIFKRLHGRDKYGGGTGAGLTVVTKIVERHGGKIWIDSEQGQGSTFYFTLEGEEL